MATKELDILKRTRGRAFKEERIELIDSLIRTLKSGGATTYLPFGKYSGIGSPRSRISR